MPRDYAADSDDDADLQYAIKLSLQKHDANAKNPIEISSDDDEDDLDKSLASSSRKATVPSAPASANEGNKTTPAPTGLGLLGLDRKKMEDERLARLRKRSTPDSEVESQDRRQRIKTIPGPKAQSTDHHPSNADPNSPPYLKGAVKRTWAFGFPRENDIKIEEVFQKDQLELAVLSSYMWDEAWLLPKLNPSTKVMLIAFAPDEASKRSMVSNVPRNLNIRFCFPPMHGIGSMHSKLQLLKFPNYLRIVVPTGNLVPYDWGETGVMENMVFLIDIPKRTGSTDAANKLTQFAEDLCYFLKKTGLDERLISSLENYDWAETAKYGFVHTIAGSHSGDSWERTGYCGLGRAVRALGLGTDGPVHVDFVAASLGSLNPGFLVTIYNAAQGDSGIREYEYRTSKSRRGNKSVSSEGDQMALLKERFRIYFPSRETVIRSRGGRQAGGTICVQRKWWESTTFPRELVRACKNTRAGLLLHSKIMFVRKAEPLPLPSSFTPNQRIGSVGNANKGSTAWAYVGSANLSESAWGRLAKDKETGRAKLNCRNWECGVVVPVQEAGGETSTQDLTGMSVFQNTIPVPFVLPAAPLEARSGDGSATAAMPWFYMED